MSFASAKPFQTTTQDRLLGLFFAVAIMTLLYMMWLGNEYDKADSDAIPFYTELTNTYGITEGATVSFKGLAIGKVQEVALSENGKVVVNVTLNNDYQSFFRQGSHLRVKSDLGLDTVLSGTGLVFEASENVTAPVLSAGSMIQSIEPKSINQLLDEWNVEELAAQVSNIVANMDKVVATLEKNQQQLISTLNNTSKLSESLISTTTELPKLLITVNDVAKQADLLLAKMNQGVDKNKDDMAELLFSANQLVSNLDKLAVSATPVANNSELLMLELSSTTIKVNQLLNKLNDHWLLGGSSKPEGQLSETNTIPSDVELGFN